MPEHSPEPWSVSDPTGNLLPECPCEKEERCILSAEGLGIIYPTDDVDNWVPSNLDRIVACVNALAGIEDPEAFVRAVWNAVRWQHEDDGPERASILVDEVCELLGDIEEHLPHA